MQEAAEARARVFFAAVAAHPVATLLGCLLVLAAFAACLPALERDPRNEAFFDPEDPAVAYRDKVREIFGLGDPVVVAVIRPHPKGVFRPHTLRLVQWLTDRIAALEGVDPDGVTSLATENDVVGTESGLLVEPFFEKPWRTQAQADALRADVMDLDVYLGSLVARDGSATLIAAEPLDDHFHARVYEQVLELTRRAPVDDERLLVAGEGAATGHIGSYITSDAIALNSAVAVVIAAILFLAHRSLRGVLAPGLVVVGSVIVAIGAMAAVGVPFYVITSALSVILISIGVCDGIHVMGRYYEELARRPGAPRRDLVVETMVDMWRPVFITSATTAIGFIALSLPSTSPPIRAFGWFAAIGVLAALVLSLLALPAILALLPARPSRAPARAGREGADAFGRLAALLGRAVLTRPRVALAAAAASVGIGAVGLLRVEVDEERIRYFRESEPIRQADRAINAALDGTTHVDVVIETSARDALLRPDHLRRIEALQSFVETLPRVGGVTSIVDHVKLLNRAMHEDRPQALAVPDSPDTVAQYFLLYSMSGDPADFQSEVDHEYRLANLRVRMTSGRYSHLAEVIRPLEAYIEREFDGDGIRVTIAGTGNVLYRLMEEIRVSHPLGVMLSLAGVWAVTALSFRSLAAGTLAVAPVALSVLLMYGVMGLTGTWLGAGTSLTGALAIGLAVDFSVHVVNRVIDSVRDRGRSLDEAFETLFPGTGRALVFAFLAIFLGFAVLLLGKVPSVGTFGLLVGTCVATSFLASLTLLPVLIRVLRPRFVFEVAGARRAGTARIG